MTTAMGPPPPRNPSSTTSATPAKASEATSTSSMAPPPPPPPKFTVPPPREPKTSEELSPSSSSMPPPPLGTRAKPQSMAPPPPPPKFTVPPPREPKTSEELPPSSSSMPPPPLASRAKPQSMAPPPPPPKFANPPPQESETSEEPSPSSSSMPPPPLETKTEPHSTVASVKKQVHIPVPYTIPSWSGAPCHQYSLEVLKDGAIIDQFEVNKKGAYMFGRVDLCDFILEHPTISRFHAVVQFKSTGEAYLYDIGSTHGTYINKNQVDKKVFVELHVGDVIRFGGSSRLYILQGPTDLMPQEADLKNMRRARIREDMKDMEASLSRAKLEASLAGGVSWGMQEDAIEEDEDEVDEVTWQNFKGQLTEKQIKTREKVLKRLEKIAHMKKEIDAIRAKDISQGGLTQGQQTQIARNEQRISQLLEELENLEETLNESIRESLGARSGKSAHGKRGGATEDGEDDYMSDEDEFYDRTKKPPKKMSDEPAVETADSLLDKKEELLKEMEHKQKLLMDEDGSVQLKESAEEGDALDAYMSSVSSQLVLDKKDQLQKELTLLQSELDRVLFLLKIADPAGEAAKKRNSQAQEPAPNMEVAVSDTPMQQPPPKKSQNSKPDDAANDVGKPKNLQNRPVDKESVPLVTAESSEMLEAKDDPTTVVHSGYKAQWLGAAHDLKKEETLEAPLDMEENDGFVPYKDRKAILENSDLENAAPGLIIRKRKEVQSVDSSDVKASEKSKEAEQKVEDTVALLLKHSKPYHASDEVEVQTEVVPKRKKARKDKKTPKKVLGPEKPSFMSDEPDYDSWVPPEGQSGDGRTSLNDRLGY